MGIILTAGTTAAIVAKRMAIELLRSLLQQATASGTKSTVLTDLRWCMAILLTALIAILEAHAPDWVLILLASFAALTFALYLAAYVYFALKAPDYLRSEKYSLSKLAIERSVTGDNLSGFVDPMLEHNSKSLSVSTPPEVKS